MHLKIRLAMYSSVPGKLITDRAGTNSVFVGELTKEITPRTWPEPRT